MFTDDKYAYEGYSPARIMNSGRRKDLGRPIDSRIYHSQNAQTVAAGVAALSRVTMYVHSGYAVPYAVGQGIRELRPQVDRMMPVKGGVLIVVRKLQSSRMTSFDSAWIGGAGPDPHTVFEEYLQTPQLVSIPPQSSIPVFEYYWATPRDDRSAISTSA